MTVDNLDEDTKNELGLGFTYVEIADDENEGMVQKGNQIMIDRPGMFEH